MFVDDKPANINAAVSLGWRGVNFRHIDKRGQMQETAEDRFGGSPAGVLGGSPQGGRGIHDMS